jgi:hypothetical protein
VIAASQPNKKEQIAAQLSVGLAEKFQKGGERGGVLSNDFDKKVPHRNNMESIAISNTAGSRINFLGAIES